MSEGKAVVAALVALAVAGGTPQSNATCPAGMALLPGGSFAMGERGDTVFIKPVCLDATEVTVGAYAACVAKGACSPALGTEDFRGGPPPKIDQASLCNGDKQGKAAHPLNCITWDQASAYCASRGQRLPTEEEWEWAARGGPSGTTYPWGNAAPSTQLCWNHLEGGKRLGTCMVGSHSSGDSPQGVKDLAGNVWEWTASSEKLEDGSDCRVRRGGGWSSNSPSRVTASVRFCDAPQQRQTDIGFRCATTPSSTAR